MQRLITNNKRKVRGCCYSSIMLAEHAHYMSWLSTTSPRYAAFAAAAYCLPYKDWLPTTSQMCEAVAAAVCCLQSMHLCRLATSIRHQIFGLMAFIKDDEAIVGRASPLRQLGQPGGSLIAGADQASVCQKDHAVHHSNLATQSLSLLGCTCCRPLKVHTKANLGLCWKTGRSLLTTLQPGQAELVIAWVHMLQR